MAVGLFTLADYVVTVGTFVVDPIALAWLFLSLRSGCVSRWPIIAIAVGLVVTAGPIANPFLH